LPEEVESTTPDTITFIDTVTFVSSGFFDVKMTVSK